MGIIIINPGWQQQLTTQNTKSSLRFLQWGHKFDLVEICYCCCCCYSYACLQWGQDESWKIPIFCRYATSSIQQHHTITSLMKQYLIFIFKKRLFLWQLYNYYLLLYHVFLIRFTVLRFTVKRFNEKCYFC